MNASSATFWALSGVRKIFSCSLYASMRLSGDLLGAGGGGGGDRRRAAQRGAEARIALMRGVDEQRRLLDQLVHGFLRRRLVAIVVGAKEVVRELAAGERIEEQLRVLEVL